MARKHGLHLINLGFPPPPDVILCGCTGHGALIAPVFGIFVLCTFVPLMGWVLVSNAAFLDYSLVYRALVGKLLALLYLWATLSTR